MPRLSPTEYEELRKRIAKHIKTNGFVPPAREIAAVFECSTTTAWRIVRGLGWRANYRHRWEKTREQRKENREQGAVSSENR